jgi:molybdate transport system substrate-binding protein
VSLATARADGVKVLTAGAMKPVLLAIADEFQKVSGHTMSVDNDTRRCAGEAHRGRRCVRSRHPDPGRERGAVQGRQDHAGRRSCARGYQRDRQSGSAAARHQHRCGVQAGAAASEIDAYIDPASGGSSGIYLAGLFQRLGIADALKPKTKLKQGGSTADLVASGEAELALQQNSEIAFAPGVTLVGPLPAEIQNYTTYAAGISTKPQSPNAALALVAWLMRPAMAPVLQAKGLLPPS